MAAPKKQTLTVELLIDTRAIGEELGKLITDEFKYAFEDESLFTDAEWRKIFAPVKVALAREMKDPESKLYKQAMKGLVARL